MQRNYRALGRSSRGALGAAALLLAGCNGLGGNGTQPPSSVGASSLPAAVAQAQAEHTPVDPALVAADNAFGLSLLTTLLPGSGGNNIAISPLSAAMALQVLYNGAQGSTQQGMAQALDLGTLSLETLNTDNAALEAALIHPDPDVTLTVANSLWIDESAYPVNPTFTQTDETYYGATVGDLSGAPANVNAWVDAETHGLIPQILQPDLPPSAFKVAIIANTLYFKGKWTTAFDPSRTDTGAFTLGDGSEVTADLMHQAGTLPYLESTFNGSRFQAIRLPYGEGRLSMLIVLPQAGTPIGPFIAGVTLEDLSHWIAGLQPTAVSIALPRFSAQYSENLVSALSALGMGVAFVPGEADFAALAPRAYVSSVVHSTVVEVDEAGTTAAAATVITVGATIALPQPIIMVMDHPFFYAIEDDATGELLFIGILMNPAPSMAG
jgi:serine protease inhibitor